MASVHSMTGVPETYGDLAMNIMDNLPKIYGRLDIVADAYKEQSIKKCREIALWSQRHLYN